MQMAAEITKWLTQQQQQQQHCNNNNIAQLAVLQILDLYRAKVLDKTQEIKTARKPWVKRKVPSSHAFTRGPLFTHAFLLGLTRCVLCVLWACVKHEHMCYQLHIFNPMWLVVWKNSSLRWKVFLSALLAPCSWAIIAHEAHCCPGGRVHSSGLKWPSVVSTRSLAPVRLPSRVPVSRTHALTH
jgi:hypothetical protein